MKPMAGFFLPILLFTVFAASFCHSTGEDGIPLIGQSKLAQPKRSFSMRRIHLPKMGMAQKWRNCRKAFGRMRTRLVEKLRALSSRLIKGKPSTSSQNVEMVNDNIAMHLARMQEQLSTGEGKVLKELREKSPEYWKSVNFMDLIKFKVKWLNGRAGHQGDEGEGARELLKDLASELADISDIESVPEENKYFRYLELARKNQLKLVKETQNQLEEASKKQLEEAKRTMQEDLEVELRTEMKNIEKRRLAGKTLSGVAIEPADLAEDGNGSEEREGEEKPLLAGHSSSGR